MSDLFIQWKDAYMIGHPIIDFEHQSLVNITNDLFKSVRADEGQKQISKSIKHLTEYVERHFEREESIFLETDYPDSVKHIGKHREIERVVNGIAIQYAADPHAIDIDEVLEFLKKWLTNHIIKTDRSYLPYITV